MVGQGVSGPTMLPSARPTSRRLSMNSASSGVGCGSWSMASICGPSYRQSKPFRAQCRGTTGGGGVAKSRRERTRQVSQCPQR